MVQSPPTPTYFRTSFRYKDAIGVYEYKHREWERLEVERKDRLSMKCHQSRLDHLNIDAFAGLTRCFVVTAGCQYRMLCIPVDFPRRGTRRSRAALDLNSVVAKLTGSMKQKRRDQNAGKNISRRNGFPCKLNRQVELNPNIPSHVGHPELLHARQQPSIYVRSTCPASSESCIASPVPVKQSFERLLGRLHAVVFRDLT